MQAKRSEGMRRKPLSQVGTDYCRPSEFAQAGFGYVSQLDCEPTRIVMLSWGFPKRGGRLGFVMSKDPYGV